MNEKQVIQGSAAIFTFVGVFALLSVIASKAKSLDNFGNTMLKMSVALGLMVLVVKMMGILSITDVIKGTLTMTAFVGVLALMSLITQLAGPNADKLGATLLAMSASLLILTGVIMLLSKMEVGDIMKGIAALTAFTGVIALLVLINKLAGKEAANISLNLLAISFGIGILAGVAILLSFIDLPGLAKGIVAVGMLSTFMALVVKATKGAKDVKGTLIVMSVAIGLLAASVVALSFIEPKKLAGATAAMSILMGMFALMVQSSKNATKAYSTIIVMVAAVTALAGILYLMSALNVESALTNSASLSLLLMSMSASMLILSKSKIGAMDALKSLGVMVLALAAIGALLWALNALDIEPSIETAIALSTLLLSLSAATLILTASGTIGGAGAALNGALGFGIVVAAIGSILLALGALNEFWPDAQNFINSGIPILNSIASGLGQAIGNFVSGLGVGLTDGLPAIGNNLSAFMTSLQPFIDGVKAIDSGTVDSISSLAGMILALTAAEVINGILSFFGLGDSLTNFGEKLVPFGESLAEFGQAINGKLDKESIESAVSAGNMLASLNASIPPQDGLLQKFLGSKNLDTFGEQLKTFGTAIVDFSSTVEGKVNEEAVEAAANAGKMLADLNDNLPPQDGMLQEFLGSKSLDTFGESLATFADAIVSFSSTVEGKVNEEAVEAATNAGNMLADLNDNLPPQDGALQKFLGSKNLDTFGTQLTTFGRAIVTFSSTVSGKIDEGAVAAATNAGNALAELNKLIPEQDGFLQSFFGTQDFETFGKQLVAFGINFALYSAFMSTVDTSVVEGTTSAAESLVALAKAVTEIEQGNLFNQVENLGSFSLELITFGSNFAQFYNNIKDIDTEQLGPIITSMERLAGLGDTVTGLDTSGLSGFGQALTEMAKADISGIEAVYTGAYVRIQTAVQGLVLAMSLSVITNSGQMLTSISAMLDQTLVTIVGYHPRFTASATNLMLKFIVGIKNSSPSANTAIKSIIETMVTTMNSYQKVFHSSATLLMTNFNNGITSGSQNGKRAIDSTLTAMVSSIRVRYSDFYNAGRYVVQGFANGITDNTYLARAKSEAMANAAKIAAQEALRIASPSKEMFIIGAYVAQGFANGIEADTPKAKESMYVLAEDSLDAIKKALDIKSSHSELAKKVIGETFVKGIAEGITEDMSAEEAAEKKAENIVKAFTEALEKIDLSSEAVSLEQKLWEAMFGSQTSSAELDAKKIQALEKEYEYQQQRVDLAKAEYIATVEEFGKDSQKAQEAYNKLLQEQIDLADITNQIADLKEAEVEREKEILDKRQELLESQYDIWLSQNSQGLSKKEKEEQENLANLALLSDKYSIQTQRVLQALQEYKDAKKLFGEDALETYEAYSEYLSQYEELSSIFSEMNELKEEKLKDENEAAYLAYKAYLDQYRDVIAAGGPRADAIFNEAFEAAKEAGYDIDAVIEAFSESVLSAVEKTTDVVSGKIESDVFNNIINADSLFDGLTEGLQNGAQEFPTEAGKILDKSFAEIGTPEKFENYGKTSGENFIKGLTTGLKTANATDEELTEAGSAISQYLVSNLQLTNVGEQMLISMASGAKAEEGPLQDTYSAILESLSEISKKQYDKFYQAGGYVVIGFANGISAKTYLAEAKARAMANAAYQAAMKALDAHSPSKLFEKVGTYIPSGLARGISSEQKLVEDASQTMSESAIESTRNVLSKIVDVINSDVETQPTIRPVLDLTNVRSEAKNLSAMLSKKTAMSISTIQNRSKEVSDTKPSKPTTPETTNNTFIQNNYSPKALSRVEIYRQTKNQFSSYARGTKV